MYAKILIAFRCNRNFCVSVFMCDKKHIYVRLSVHMYIHNGN